MSCYFAGFNKRADIRIYFPDRLRSRLAHQIPKWKAAFEHQKLDRSLPTTGQERRVDQDPSRARQQPELTLAEELRAARHQAYQTQEQAAEEIGIDVKGYRDFEKDSRKPKRPEVRKKVQKYLADHPH